MTLLTVFVGVIAFSSLILLIGLGVLAFAVKRLIDQPVRQVMNEAQTTLHNVHELVDRVEDRTERLLDIGEETARKVSGNVMVTSDLMRETIVSPLISFSGLIAGISEAVQYCRRASARS